jgi:hypothetical protein
VRDRLFTRYKPFLFILFDRAGEKASVSMRNLSNVLVGARLVMGILALSAVFTFFSVIMLTTA